MTALVVYYYQDILAMSYDEEFAQIRGVPVKKLYFGLIGMLAVTIVLVIQVVGLILVIALLTIPPFIVEKYANSLVQMMVASSILGAVFTITGLWLSYHYNLTSGASIIMVSGIVFLISFPVVDKIRGADQKKEPRPLHQG
jgi:zinc transport system permease protein